MAIAVGLATVGAYLALGPDLAFKPDTFEPSTLWLVVCFAFSLLAAVAGGFVCSRISGPGATKVLAGLVLVLGILMALPALNTAADTRPTVRLPDTPSLTAMQNQRQPPWAAMSFPLIGAVGVLIGGSRKRS
jgi:uncharacterized membrane protein YfcA